MTGGNEEVVRLKVADGIAEIRFNRPRQLNALNRAIAQQFDAILDRTLSDKSIRVVVLAGEGRAFMAGGDLTLFRGAADKPGAARDLIEVIHGSLKRMAAAPQITVASLRGPVAGAGMSLALQADFAIAGDDVTFDLSYAKIGASPDCGASWMLPRLVGTRRALEIALLSRKITSDEALTLGLVNRVVPAANLETETASLAMQLASGPAVAQAWIKRLMRSSFNHTLAEQLDLECTGFATCAGTQDFSAALEAFFDKRRPEFLGH